MTDSGSVKEALKRRARIEKATNELGFFRRTYIDGPDGSPFRGGPHHEQMDEKYLSGSNVAFCAPVGFAKSQWMLSAILWEICRNPKECHIIYASHSYTVATDMMNAVQYNLQFNDRLVEDFGPFKSDDVVAWRGDKFYVKQNKNPRVPTMTIVGAKGRIENVRVERLFCDDVVTLDSAMSETERKKVENWFFTEFFNRLNVGGKVCLIGSRFHPFDLYNTLEEQANWDVTKFKAVEDWEEEKVLWPERWSMEELTKRRDTIGSAIFEARYQQNPESLYGSYFKSENIKFTTKDSVPELQQLYQGWDFNLSEKEQADYTVGVTMGVSEEGDWYLIDVYREHLKENHARAVKRQFEKHRTNPWNAPINGVFCESNLFQDLIGNEVKKVAPHINIIPVNRAKDKVVRAMRIQPFFEQERVFFCRDSDNIETMVSELLAFPSEGSGTKDDFVDALEVCMSPFSQGGASNSVKVIGGLDEILNRVENNDDSNTGRWWA